MRFLEWVQDHPGGVISLPTGKTPEHFINWVNRLVQTWDEPETRELLEKRGVDPSPQARTCAACTSCRSTSSIRSSRRRRTASITTSRSSTSKAWGWIPHKALLMNCQEIGLGAGAGPRSDLARLDRRPEPCARARRSPISNACSKRVLARIDDWCQQYEEQIRALGGIGFFLGGIGPDGHIGFNVRGSDHYLDHAADGHELRDAGGGGRRPGRHRGLAPALVITIGLGTITHNPDCAAIIIAAGEAKAGVVADAVQGRRACWIPASALRTLPNARFYITLGAAKQLRERQVSLLRAARRTISDEQVDAAVVDLALQRNKRCWTSPSRKRSRIRCCARCSSGAASRLPNWRGWCAIA